MGKIVNEKEYEQCVNIKNKEISADFLIEKKAEGKSQQTLIQYEGDLKILCYIIYKNFNNKILTELTRKEIRNMSIYFQNQGLSNSRVNRLMSALRSTLEFCADDDDYDYDFNVASRVKGLPNLPIREITFLEHEQIEWLIDEALRRKKTIMAMYLALLYYSSKRRSEVYQVQKHELANRYFTNIVIGKGNKKFRLYYNDRVRDIIKMYLEERGEDDISALFVRVYKNGKRRR